MSTDLLEPVPTALDFTALAPAIAKLAQGASIEINAADEKHLDASRQWLRPGTRVYISHLPNQTWEQTAQAARAVQAHGFTPVPHIPVRLLPNQATLDRVLGDIAHAGVEEVLLIAGDYPQAMGPYRMVSEVLQTGLLGKHGFSRVSLAGHPEGHTKVDLATIRAAEVDKLRFAAEAGLAASLVTQFFFEAKPFLDWSAQVHSHGLPARLVGGLAGPASIATLVKFAMRCGAGPSMRALGANPSSVLKLLGDRGPERVVTDLALGNTRSIPLVDGLHFFCFGGFLRTSQWIHDVARGQIRADAREGFVRTS
jgi:methylenetetrahydrofolate reductase (NADPH)